MSLLQSFKLLIISPLYELQPSPLTLSSSNYAKVKDVYYEFYASWPPEKYFNKVHQYKFPPVAILCNLGFNLLDA